MYRYVHIGDQIYEDYNQFAFLTQLVTNFYALMVRQYLTTLQTLLNGPLMTLGTTAVRH